MDRELLEKYNEGLIALSGCLAGEIPRLLMRGEYDKAKETALWYRDLFGEGKYFIEIQNHGLREQLEIIPDLIRLSKELSIPLVATNDAHYLKREDAASHDVLLCIQTAKKITDNDRMRFETNDFYVKKISTKSRRNQAETIVRFSHHGDGR